MRATKAQRGLTVISESESRFFWSTCSKARQVKFQSIIEEIMAIKYYSDNTIIHDADSLPTKGLYNQMTVFFVIFFHYLPYISLSSAFQNIMLYSKVPNDEWICFFTQALSFVRNVLSLAATITYSKIQWKGHFFRKHFLTSQSELVPPSP